MNASSQKNEYAESNSLMAKKRETKAPSPGKNKIQRLLQALTQKNDIPLVITIQCF